MTVYDELEYYVDEVEAQLAREEFDFPSTMPVLGPVIRAVRKVWNSVSTRWYVRHYAQQQAQFDMAVLRALRTTQYCCQQLSAQVADLTRDSLRHNQETSARLYNQAQQLSFVQGLLEKDLQTIVQHMYKRYVESAPPRRTVKPPRS